jgi:aspartyl-tRNA(Asn)/glutamyl-tRNA(Gln) amidotransferase subunit C
MFDITDYEAMAMLELTDGERELLRGRFAALAEGFAALEQIDTDGVAPLVTVLDLHNVLREDKAEKHLSRADILANAPEQYDGYFQVPETFG